MMAKRFFLMVMLVALLPGCAQFYGSQPPAPVYGGAGQTATKPQQPAYPGGKEQQRVSKGESGDTVMTEPLEEPKKSPATIEFKPEPMQPDNETVESDSQAGEQPPPLTQSLESMPKAQESIPEPRTLTPFEPLETSASMSPAVDALVLAANQNTSSGNLEVASATIERAIRIEPRNANLYYKLALVRLDQSKPRLAEDLAKKSALLAASDSTLKKHSWLLIAHARELQNNFKGAKEARAKANRL